MSTDSEFASTTVKLRTLYGDRVKSAITQALSTLAYRFADNELAYLALTSKPELPIRDRLAFALHTEFANGELRVAREWRRSDLAILSGKQPVAIVELKAMYHFDAIATIDSKNKPNGFQLSIARDISKAQKLGNGEADIYALLLSVHPHEKIKDELQHIVKYSRGINKAYERESSAGIYADADKVILTWCRKVDENGVERGDELVTKGVISAGSAFGVGVEIGYWLFGPFGCEEKNVPEGLRFSNHSSDGH